MPERAAASNTAAPPAADQPFCSTCCARLELGSLFCGICLKNKLLRLVTEGLESELTELPAPVCLPAKPTIHERAFNATQRGIPC